LHFEENIVPPLMPVKQEDCLNKIQRYELLIGSCGPTQCGGIQILRDSAIFKEGVLAKCQPAITMMHAGSSMHVDVDGEEFVVEKMAGKGGPYLRIRHPCCEEVGNICCQPCMDLEDKLSRNESGVAVAAAIPGKKLFVNKPFQVDANGLERMAKMWEMFIGESAILATAAFPHAISDNISAEAPMIWFPENMAGKIGNFHLLVEDWMKLVAQKPSHDKRVCLEPVKPMTTNENGERLYMTTTWVQFLPTVAFLELDPTIRRNVHLLGHDWYGRITQEGKSRRNWTTANAQNHFDLMHTKSLDSWSFLLEADAVIHIMIYSGKHFSSVSVFNLTSSLFGQNHKGCFLGIDFLKCHPLQEIANTIAM